MNLRLILYFISSVCFIYSCKDSATNPVQTGNKLIGTWEYSGVYGFVDMNDPIHPFFPKYIFSSDNSFEESARFVKLPEKEYIGYKYVKTGTYGITSNIVSLIIKNEIYINYEDSLQVKPVPLPVTHYSKKYIFIVTADTLKLALADIIGAGFISYFRK